MTVKFVIYGDPAGKGRPNFARIGSGVKTYTPEKTANYETLVKWVYQQSAHGTKFADNDMLDVRLFLYYSVPKSASKKKKELMLKGQVRPTKRPDIDNVVKIILDALNGLAYRDDAQVVDCMVRKFYSENPRVAVTIQEAAFPEK